MPERGFYLEKPSYNKYIAICPEEFREIVAADLKNLGAIAVEPEYKAVSFQCTERLAYEIHLKLGTASRILRVLREGFAKDVSAVFFQASKIRWSDLLDSRTTFLVEGVAGDRDPDSPGSNQISRAIREALQKHFTFHKIAPPQVDLKEPMVRLVGYYHGRRICISVDTSGKSMHKRGYKSESHPAPIKEHIAAAMLRAAGYNGQQVLWDPMCGSGTIPIEASFIALGKGPLIHRKKGEFGFEQLKDFDRKAWREAQDAVRQGKSETPIAPIYASDISMRYAEMTRMHALRARVERHMEIRALDFLDAHPMAEHGILVLNMPYGERLTSAAAPMEEFYAAVGQRLKTKFTGWTAAMLVADGSPWQKIGLKPTKKIKMENGGIACRLLIFDLYQGSRKPGKQAETQTELH